MIFNKQGLIWLAIVLIGIVVHYRGNQKRPAKHDVFLSHHSKLNTLWLLSASKGAIRIAGARAGFALSQNEPLLNALSNTITRAQSFPSKLNTNLPLIHCITLVLH